MPKEYFTGYFSPDPKKPGNFIISEEIRKRLIFRRHDLLTLQPVRDQFALISCKNVLLHFTEEERVNVIRMFYDSLVDGGYLLTEQTQKMPQELTNLFEQVVSHAQVFKKLPVR